MEVINNIHYLYAELPPKSINALPLIERRITRKVTYIKLVFVQYANAWSRRRHRRTSRRCQVLILYIEAPWVGQRQKQSYRCVGSSATTGGIVINGVIFPTWRVTLGKVLNRKTAQFLPLYPMVAFLQSWRFIKTPAEVTWCGVFICNVASESWFRTF